MKQTEFNDSEINNTMAVGAGEVEAVDHIHVCFYCLLLCA